MLAKQQALLDRLPALAAAGFGFVLYAAFSFPAPDWLDAPEFITAATRLGVFHPPGSVLAVLIGHLFTLWPSDCVGRRLLLFSALFAALSLYLLTRIMQDCWSRIFPNHKSSGQAFSLSLAGWFAFCPALIDQAVRPEVYTLGLFLFLAALREALLLAMGVKREDLRPRLWRLCVYTGMGLAVHPLMALSIVGGGLALLAFSSLRRQLLTPANFAHGWLALGLGALPLVLIPLMTREALDLRWEDTTTLLGWLRCVFGASFSASFQSAGTETFPAGPKALLAVYLGAGGLVTLLGGFGLYALIRSEQKVAGLLFCTGLASVASLASQRAVRLDNPDVGGYALPAIACLFLLAALGLAAAAQMLRHRCSWAPRILPLLIALALALQLFTHTQPYDRSGCSQGRALAKKTLAQLPPHTVVLAADFNLVFMFDYLTRVERQRPDVKIVYLRDLDNPALRKALATQHPQLEAALPKDARLTESSLRALSAQHPVAVDWGPHLLGTWSSPSKPAGLLHLLPPFDSLEAFSLATVASPPSCPPGGGVDARSAAVLAWHAYWQSLAASQQGLASQAAQYLQVAHCASPLDEEILHAWARLGLGSPGPCPGESGTSLDPQKQTRGSCAQPNKMRALALLLSLLLWATALLSRIYADSWIKKMGLSLLGFALMLLCLL